MKMELEKLVKEHGKGKPWFTEKKIAQFVDKLANSGLVTESELLEKIKEFDDFNKFLFFLSFKRPGKEPYYSLPLFYQAHQKTTIRIIPKYRCLTFNGTYKVAVIPYMDYAYKAFAKYKDDTIIITSENNAIEFDYTFQNEQRYQISLYWCIEDQELLVFKKYVYALEPDLFNLTYLKGDLHCHTNISDGFEAPELLISVARKYGLDFIAITDHNGYEGSVVGETAAKSLGNKITVLRGEEYSLDYTPMHILSIGAPKALPLRYTRKDILSHPTAEKLLTDHSCSDYDITAYACNQALFDLIRENGGISIICHPMWKPLNRDGSRMDVPLSLLLALLKNKRFDGIEVVSGSDNKNEISPTNMQDLLFREIGVKYEDLPIIGVTDSHHYLTNPISGLHYTIVFSESNSADSIVDAIRNNRTVAVSQREKNGEPLCYGSLRYSLFAKFLIEQYFPERDDIAFTEGMKMLSEIKFRDVL